MMTRGWCVWDAYWLVFVNFTQTVVTLGHESSVEELSPLHKSVGMFVGHIFDCLFLDGGLVHYGCGTISRQVGLSGRKVAE